METTTNYPVRFVGLGSPAKLGDDFPGWGADFETVVKPYLEAHRLQHGEVGRIVDIESHGSNPWTRYTVEFEDGGRVSGMYPTDLEPVR
jgi:hypothetical protein